MLYYLVFTSCSLHKAASATLATTSVCSAAVLVHLSAFPNRTHAHWHLLQVITWLWISATFISIIPELMFLKRYLLPGLSGYKTGLRHGGCSHAAVSTHSAVKWHNFVWTKITSHLPDKWAQSTSCSVSCGKWTGGLCFCRLRLTKTLSLQRHI